MYSCCYPIEHTFTNSNTIDYRIVVNGVTIYTGELLPYNPAESTLTIDISPICRSYLDTFYENIIVNTLATPVPVVDGIATIHTFMVYSSSNPGAGSDETAVSYQVVYDYNTEYAQPLPDVSYLNDPIDNIIDPRQRVFASAYNVGGAQAYSATLNGAVVASGSLNTQQIHMFPVDLAATAATEGDTLVMSATGAGDTTYKVTRSCPHRYVVYYVNKYGGLDSLLCTGRHIQGWSPSRVDAKLYDDRLNRRDFQQRRIYQDIDHTFTLNTGLLSNTGAEKIDHLIYSPKVFLHDLEKNTITSCLITDTTYQVKVHRYDRLVQYTFGVKESQQQIRK